jgi:hypothetical protein
VGLRILLLSTASRWLGTARMPRVLDRAGFEVCLLAPTDSLAARSRYISRVRFLPDNAIPMEWLLAMIKAVDEVSPQVLLPCDEMAIRLLFSLVREPPTGLTPAVHSRLAALIRDSLGDPDHYETSIDKTLLPPAAEALGIRVPPYTVVRDVGEALAFATTQGYPLVLKRRFGFAGEGVAIVRTRDELARTAPTLMRPDQLDLGEHRAPQLLVQVFVDGAHHAQALVAWRGVPLAGFAWERYAATRPVKGQTSVVRFVDSPQTRAFAEKLTQGFGICGFFSVQHIVRPDTGEAYLLEINRRVVTHMHMGERVGADLAFALYRHLTGAPVRLPDERNGGNGTVAVFPREWLRDPDSRYLRDFPADIPWDDPELFAAMLAMRHDV